MSELDSLDISESKKRYVRELLNPLLEDMVMDSLFAAELDKDPTAYLLAWCNLRQGATATEYERLLGENKSLQDKIKQCERSMNELKNAILQTKDEDEKPEEEEEEEDDDVILSESEFVKQNEGKANQMRTSVSAEAYGEWNQKKEFTPPVHAKSTAQKKRLGEVLEKSFMFKALDKKDMVTIIDAMEEVSANAGDKLISLGDEGDFLFVIEKGSLECRKEINGVDTLLKTVEEGDAFGELSLLYNCPRAANVLATQECILWKLDRDSFNHIVKDGAAKKRNRYEGFLAKVPLLKDMDSYQRSQVCDGLHVESFTAGTNIITEGEDGDKFFILEDGKASAVKDGTKVLAYGEGDFFGELALLKNAPRAATVVAETDVKCLIIDRRAFKRLFGGGQELQSLAEQAKKY